MKYLAMTGVLFCLAVMGTANANLLINPTRVQLNPGDRSTELTLINTSNEATTYRLEWVEKLAKEGGGYNEMTPEQIAKFPVASSMLRFTPRNVTLQPNERQTIKLALRRPANLPAGEYRSHLLFKAMPSENAVNAPQNGQSMAVNIVLSFAIPVVVRQGELQYQVNAEDISLAFDPKTKEAKVRVHMSRAGMHSVLGDISAYWTPKNGSEILIAKSTEYSIWTELSKTYADLNWVGTDFAFTDGKLRVVYEGSKDFKGITFFDKTINVSKESIKIAN
jgi:fimbrial chaperone protein